MKTGPESAKLWESHISGVELFQAHLFHHRFGKHFHETYTIGLNDSGQGGFLHQGTSHGATPGQFNLINPGEVHTGQVRSSEGWAFRDIYISVSQVEQLLAQLEWHGQGMPYFSEPVVGDQALQSAFHRLFTALSEPVNQLTQQSLMLGFFSQLFSKYAKPRYSWQATPPETQAISRVRAYLEEHYAENLSINTLAQFVGLSPFYLIRSFHQQMGLPPHSYQRHWQLLQAKQALRSSKPLSDIAVEHGFYDQSHFNRHFKRAFGLTPGQYRKNNRTARII